MLTPFEALERDEEKHAAHIVEILRRKQEKDYAPGSTRRDAHPKHTGLVQAVFTVDSSLPPELRVGVFAEPRSFGAWVRFSNSNGTVQSDAVKDVRGCAIKLLDVPGERLQDFLLINIPTMPLGTMKLFHDIIYLSTEWSPLLFLAKMILTGHAHLLKELQDGQVTPTSPADIRYWSTTPYLFGADRVVKYSLVPTSTHMSRMPETLTDDYLSETLQQHLAAHEATFDFKVQVRTEPDKMPIEDASVEWSEDRAPFFKVATLRIPMQQFRTPERAELSEKLSFSPAHALEEHRAIGAINRGRIRIYAEQSAFRHQRDSR